MIGKILKRIKNGYSRKISQWQVSLIAVLGMVLGYIAHDIEFFIAVFLILDFIGAYICGKK